MRPLEERRSYERRYLQRLREFMAEGVGSAVYDLSVKEVDLWPDGPRTWVYVLFTQRQRPACEFGRAGRVWGENLPDTTPDGGASTFEVGLLEQLDAAGYGLPLRCEPGRVTWLHPYGRPPWDRSAPPEEPERRAYEQRFLARLHELLATPLGKNVELGDVELRDRRGETFATVTFGMADRPGCTFAQWTRVWIGYLAPKTPETRAETLYRHFVEGLDRMPERCEPGGLTWYGETPFWLKSSQPRGG